MSGSRRVVVTGKGVVTPIGNDVPTFWAALKEGQSGLGPLRDIATKSMHGHLLGASGGVEAVACVKAIKEKFIPATIGLSEPDPRCDLDYVPHIGRVTKVGHAMSNSFAFGGLNAVLLFGEAPA
jgi:3-oxoacyl-(acyl-carrier-protein) synthase